MTAHSRGQRMDFKVAALPKRAPVTVLLLALAPLVFLLVATLLQPEHANWQGVAVAGVGCALIGALLLLAMARRGVRIEAGVLSIRASFYTCKVGLSAIDTAATRIVDLREHPGLRPRWKTNGYSVPGFHAGHYRLREGGRGFCLLTDPSRVLVLPERNGRRLLISLDAPRALLDAVTAGASDAR